MMPVEYLNNKVFEANIVKFKQAKQNMLRYEMIIYDLKEAVDKKTTTSKKRGETLKVKENEYKMICKEFKDSQAQLASDFSKIAEGIISYRKFYFVESEDAIQEFIMTCFDKIDRFDPNYVNKNGQKTKAFNYTSTVVLNCYRQLYRTARNYNELKRKFGEHLQDEQPVRKKNVNPRMN